MARPRIGRKQKIISGKKPLRACSTNDAGVLEVRRIGWLDRMARGVDPAQAEDGPGRNDPCPCGSGAKWKRCCGGGA